MSSIKACCLMWLDCGKKGFLSLKNNPVIIISSAATYAIGTVAAAFLSRFGLAGGILLGFLWTALLSFYYSWLSEIYASRKIRFSDLFQFNQPLFFSIINTAFIIWIAQWMVQMLTSGMHIPWASPGLSLVIVLIFNSLPESIYINRADGVSALSDSWAFIQKNHIEWFLPFIILISPLLIIAPQATPFLIAKCDPLLPVSILAVSADVLFADSLSSIAALFIWIIVINWFMLFRSHLFDALNSGNRRLRAFKASL